MQRSPLGLISLFRQKQLGLSADLPRFQPLVAFTQLFMSQFPHDLASPIAADPLSIEIDVEIDIEAALDMYRHVGGRNRLTEG